MWRRLVRPNSAIGWVVCVTRGGGLGSQDDNGEIERCLAAPHHGVFLQRYSKQMPIGAGEIMRLYLVTGTENGQLCLEDDVIHEASHRLFPVPAFGQARQRTTTIDALPDDPQAIALRLQTGSNNPLPPEDVFHLFQELAYLIPETANIALLGQHRGTETGAPCGTHSLRKALMVMRAYVPSGSSFDWLRVELDASLRLAESTREYSDDALSAIAAPMIRLGPWFRLICRTEGEAIDPRRFFGDAYQELCELRAEDLETEHTTSTGTQLESPAWQAVEGVRRGAGEMEAKAFTLLRDARST